MAPDNAIVTEADTNHRALFAAKCRWGRLGERRRVSAWLYFAPASLRLAQAIPGLAEATHTQEVALDDLAAVELRTRVTSGGAEATVVLRLMQDPPLAIQDLSAARAEELTDLIARLIRRPSSAGN